MRKILIPTILFCCACHSKPVKTTAETVITPPAANAKASATPDTSKPSGRELLTMVNLAPRRSAELESKVSLNADVQGCFRSQPAETPLTVVIEGKVSYQGALDSVQIKDAAKAVNECLTTALKGVSLGRGKIGRFKMQLSTDRSKFPGAKGLLLDATPAKKFE